MKLYEFKPAAKEGNEEFPATRKERDYSKPRCDHGRVEVDLDARTLDCRDCRAAVDPMAYISYLAGKWDAERFRVKREKTMDRRVIDFHKLGGRITVRPSGVVADLKGRRWSTSVSGGVSAQLENVMDRVSQDGIFDPPRAIPGFNPPKAPA